MSVSFNPHTGLVLVDAELEGPYGTVALRMALDTGATRTSINTGLLLAVGCDPTFATQHAQVTTGSGVQLIPLVPIRRLSSLGQHRTGITVLGHTLPPSANIDGVLGLDFLRGLELTINFRTGIIDLL